jgi:release factor glutamine methyltransferase
MTVREALSTGQAQFRQGASDTPYLDAVVLLTHAVGISKERLFARLTEALPAAAEERFRGYVAARLSGTPVAYLTGRKEFYGRPFRVDERALIPRPDTEVLVDTVLELLPASADGIRVHDCCTGTGCIAVTLAAERRRWEVSASDISAAALELFRENCHALLGGALPCYTSDLLAAVPGSFTLITANPPYVADREVERMSHVRAAAATGASGAGRAPAGTGSLSRAGLGTGSPGGTYREPARALAAGEDGLDLLRPLVPQAFSKLEKHGYFVTEIGHDHAGAACELFSKAGFTDIETREDLEGRSRVCYGRR